MLQCFSTLGHWSWNVASYWEGSYHFYLFVFQSWAHCPSCMCFLVNTIITFCFANNALIAYFLIKCTAYKLQNCSNLIVIENNPPKSNASNGNNQLQEKIEKIIMLESHKTAFCLYILSWMYKINSDNVGKFCKM